MANYNLNVSACSHEYYPMDICFCVLWGINNDNIGLMPEHPVSGEWGMTNSIALNLIDEVSMPKLLDLIWLSIIEEKTYSLEEKIDYSTLKELLDNSSDCICSIIIGLAPYGNVAMWGSSKNKRYVVGWYKGVECNISVQNFYDTDADISYSRLCNNYIENNTIAKQHLKKYGLPSHLLFDNYMKQFTYRYQICFEKWNRDEEKWERYNMAENFPQYDFIEETLFDGTFDKLHNDGLLKYHKAGKPKKLAVKWHINKSEYEAYFWFDDEKIREIFDRFYGMHPETKTDFLIRTDYENKKYELSLFRQGLKEPLRIPISAYQLIVFKNGFEDFHSMNYDQVQGAWIW